MNVMVTMGGAAPSMPSFLQTVAAQLRFEWARRWWLLLFSLFGVAAVPLAVLGRAPADVLGAGFGLALAMGLAALLGYDAVFARQADRSIAFDLLQPVRPSALLVGRGLFALLFGLLCFVVTATPGAIVALVAGRPFETGMWQLGVAAAPLGLLVGITLSAVFGTRDPWFGVHVVPGAAVALGLLWIQRRTEAFGVDVVYGIAVVAIGVALAFGLLWGWWAQLQQGRVDSVRGHRSLVWRLWLPIGLALLVSVATAARVTSPKIEDLNFVHSANGTSSGGLVTLELAKSRIEKGFGPRIDFAGAYALDGSGGTLVALPGDPDREGAPLPVPNSQRVLWSSADGLRWIDLDSGDSGIYTWPTGRADRWSVSPEGRHLVAVFLEGSDLPRWVVRRLDLESGLWSPPVVLEGIAQRRYPPGLSWLSAVGRTAPVARATVGLSDRLAWFDLGSADWKSKGREQRARGTVDYELLPWLAGGIANTAAVPDRTRQIHQSSNAGDRVLLRDGMRLLVTDADGTVLWTFERLPVDTAERLADGRVAPTVPGATGAPFQLWTAAWREGRLFVQTWFQRERDDPASGYGELLEIVEGRVTRSVAVPAPLRFGATVDTEGRQIALAWVEPNPASHRVAGILDLGPLEIRPLADLGSSRSWLLGVGKAGSASQRQQLVADRKAVFRVDFSDGSSTTLLELDRPSI